ncbi:TPA: IS3 family transposase, partial [Streptococcus pyogenes]|nr:IS3 family transposase [Streptococcus pyogenes]
MKFNQETKVKIYELRQMGESIKSISKKFDMAESDLKYMIRLIDRYGVTIVQKC